jgi:hypothetical protein
MSADAVSEADRGLDRSRDRSPRVTLGLARHGIPGLRGQVAASEGARFGSMFADLDLEPAPLDLDTAAALASAMIERPGTFNPNTRVPAGYTYFGQYVDHDLTFDPTSTLGRHNDPSTLHDFRTPRFDLDSLYGSGPMDQPFLYDWSTPEHRGVKLLVGRNPEGPEFAPRDLPRNQQGRALVGDARNDENLIVAQLHLLFIRFHNRVVDLVRDQHPRIGSTRLFEEAQRLVRWHYQWIVKHDFLRRIAGPDAPLVEPRRFRWDPDEGPFMPVEFSVAAFRFGHSMVRNDYRANDGHANVPILKPRSPMGQTLAGFRRLPAGLEVEWKHFFPIDPRLAPQRSMRIDASLVAQLSQLPPDGASLPFLNLRRGTALGLPCGADVATAMGDRPLDEGELRAALPPDADEQVLDAVLDRTPLWFYLLAEAKARGNGGLQLGRTGGLIVAEVINGLLEADPHSFVNHDGKWTPELADPPGTTFEMADLVKFTLGPRRG